MYYTGNWMYSVDPTGPQPDNRRAWNVEPNYDPINILGLHTQIFGSIDNSKFLLE